MRPKILIVEDEAIIYERLRRALLEENFEVFDYTPSYEDAILLINSTTPDVALLDIKLKGQRNGLDLGELLDKDYNIPFIYVTEFDDNHTFYKGLTTHHASFVVKTKPFLNAKEIIRAVHTVLNNYRKLPTFNNTGVLGLTDYLDNIKEGGYNETVRVPVSFEDIAFFSNRDFDPKSKVRDSLRPNYIWFQTRMEGFLIRSSLKKIVEYLPHYFVRVNESYIVNLRPDFFEGVVSNGKLIIRGKQIGVSKTYRKEVEERLNILYKG